MDNTEDELVSTRAPIKIDKPFSQPATNISYSASYTPRTDSTSPLYPNATLPAASTSSSNIYNIIESIYEGLIRFIQILKSHNLLFLQVLQ